MLLTIITPTYNRGTLLKNCYMSLKQQKNINFEWLIIDDGSTDNTYENVEDFIKEGLINIRYYYKENGGKHTALNYAIKKARGTLTLILDSDDILVKEATDLVEKIWKKNRCIDKICGLSFHRGYDENNIIGQKFPSNYFLSDYIECRMNLGIQGDKAEVYLTDILKNYKFPEFSGEKFIGEHIVWVRMARMYKTLHINKIIYITEYLEGGLTKSGRKLRVSCPLGGMLSSKECTGREFSMKVRTKNMILYICYGFFANKSIYEMIREITNKCLFIVTLIPGYLLYKVWRIKYC